MKLEKKLYFFPNYLFSYMSDQKVTTMLKKEKYLWNYWEAFSIIYFENSFVDDEIKHQILIKAEKKYISCSSKNLVKKIDMIV